MGLFEASLFALLNFLTHFRDRVIGDGSPRFLFWADMASDAWAEIAGDAFVRFRRVDIDLEGVLWTDATSLSTLLPISSARHSSDGSSIGSMHGTGTKLNTIQSLTFYYKDHTFAIHIPIIERLHSFPC
jgi:hypothetical protein